MRSLNKSVWPFQTLVRFPELDDEIDRWCRNYFENDRDWFSYRFRLDEYMYAFKDEAAFLLFRIRWGNHENS
jgi:hypothetical protein